MERLTLRLHSAVANAVCGGRSKMMQYSAPAMIVNEATNCHDSGSNGLRGSVGGGAMFRRILNAVLLTLAAVLLALPAFADSQVRIVRLSQVDGDVQADRNTGQGFEKAFLNMPVTQGMKLRTNRDRKSTRLNSSHLVISYAVFCLKKKKHKK